MMKLLTDFLHNIGVETLNSLVNSSMRIFNNENKFKDNVSINCTICE